MAAHIKKGGKITKMEWDDYYRVQKSGVMNMMYHPLIGLFMPSDNYKKAYEHFETNDSTEDLIVEEVIER